VVDAEIVEHPGAPRRGGGPGFGHARTVGLSALVAAIEFTPVTYR
jgi:hypothetical protein